MRFWGKVITITWKDTLSEIRTKEIISSVLVFTLLVIVIFNFAFAANREIMKLVAPGILWATFAFAGVLSLNRSFVPEKEQGCLEGLMLCPVGREVIYVGKMLGSLLFMLVIEMIALPIFTFLFNLPVLSLQMVTIALLATIGFVSVGTLFAALAVNTKARELVLPVLFLPVVVPVIIGAVEASRLALAGEPWSRLTSWLGIIAAFDVIFLVVSYLVFPFVIEE
ncbi:MAG TPA: heme ABC transporter permease CcmB [Dehalococcoidia bacterium]|jgi:heme exporter protein B|nr:heme ABC transporter permease CcmB [Dehalococcoidia bacterium]